MSIIFQSCLLFSIFSAVEGTSDDLDVPIKAVFGDWAFVKKHNLCSINSINWARVLVQAGHFVYSYYQLAERLGQEVEVVIPTGACGNITGTHIETDVFDIRKDGELKLPVSK